MRDVELGKLKIKKVFESNGALPFSMSLPEASADDFASAEALVLERRALARPGAGHVQAEHA